MKKLLSLTAAFLITAIAMAQDTIPTPAKKGFPDSARLDTAKWNKSTTPLSTDSKWRDSSNGVKNRMDSSMNGASKWADTAMNNAGNMNTSNAPVDSARRTGTQEQRSTKTDDMGNKSSTTTTTATDSMSTVKKAGEDKVIMINDKMMIVKGGDSTLLTDSIKLKSGAVVRPDGTVRQSSGTTTKLKNGQYVNLNPAEKKTTTTKKTTKTTTVTKPKKKA